MTRNRIAKGLAGVSLLLANAALLFLAFWPYSYKGTAVSTDGGVVDETSASLIEQNGMGVLVWLIIPVVLCLVAFLVTLSRIRGGKVIMWAMAVLLLLFGLVSILSIGAFYLPAALALIIAAATAKTSNIRSLSG